MRKTMYKVIKLKEKNKKRKKQTEKKENQKEHKSEKKDVIRGDEKHIAQNYIWLVFSLI